MKKKFVTIYSVFASLTFLFSIAFFSYSLINEVKNGNERCANRFNFVVELMTKNPNNTDAKKLFTDFDDFALINIYKNGKLISNFPEVASVQENSNSTFIKTFSYSFSFGQDNYSIKTVMYILRPSKIYSSALFAFLIILVATIFTLLLIIILTVKEKKSPEQQLEEENEEQVENLEKIEESNTDLYENQKNEDFEDSNFSKAINSSQEEKSDFDENSILKTDEDFHSKEENFDSSKNNEEKNENNEKDTYYEEPIDKSNIEENIQNDQKETELQEQKNKDPIEENIQQPDFEETLSKELVKAGSSEQDLALILVKIPELNEQLYESILQELVQNFMLKRNLIFRKESDCIAIIKNNTTIEEAEEFAEKIRNQILTLEDTTCFIGISCRAIRLVSAERIILESEQALQHAQEESDSPIIGFHVDIEKYMQYLKENSK